MILRATVTDQEVGLRLDDGAKILFPQLSKGQIRKIVDWGGCSINDSMVRVASRKLHKGDEIILGVMEAERYQEVRYGKAEILLEDADFLAIKKAAGLNSQRTPYQLKGTVEHAVALYLQEIQVQEPARVIHRLDRGTSGVMFFPKNKKAATHLGYLFKQGGVEKLYWALVEGRPEQQQWRIEAPIAKLNKFRYGVATPGREAITDFRIISVGHGFTLLEARPLTGRTHQIRVHLAHSGLPIVGDTLYGGPAASRIMLHCRRMSFQSREGRLISATAPPDATFAEVCRDAGIAVEQLEAAEESRTP